MPKTVKELFSNANLSSFKKIAWGEIPKIEKNGKGIYVVSSSNNPEMHLGIIDKPSINQNILNLWINKHKKFTIDGAPAQIELLSNTLTKFWLNDESILYIGKADLRKKGTGLKKRIVEFYNTEIGEKSPHAGGQWIKVLSDLENFSVYYCICDHPTIIEKQMLLYFSENISKSLYNKLLRMNGTMPFGNVKFNGYKKHGFKDHYYK